ncbi:hypothetical protein V1281_006900 [Nitrobacteraceae bacterium AZCC 2161]
MSLLLRLKLRLTYMLGMAYLRLQAIQLETARRLRDKLIVGFPTPEDKAAYIEKLNDEKVDLKTRSERDFFRCVGIALTQWMSTEQQLAIIFSILLRTTPERAGVILYSITNFNVWLSIIDELFSSDKDLEVLKKRWNKFNERMRSLKDTRDRLAHHTAVSSDHDHAARLFEITVLRPSPFDTRKKSLKYQPLTFMQVNEFIDTVATLNLDLAFFVDSMFEYIDLEEDASPATPAVPDIGPRPPSDSG